MCEDITNYCRICLDVDSDHMSILQDQTIHLQMKSCLGMSVSGNDGLPKVVCVSCVSQLRDFYNFQMNARYSQHWLESCVHEKSKKSTEAKTHIQPLPDSEYNSDSLLEFLNNTANIEEYLNNLGKEDIPAIVNMLDKNQENSLDGVTKVTNTCKTKQPSPKKREVTKSKNCKLKMEIDVLDSDKEIVKEILLKETEPKKPKEPKLERQAICFGCEMKFDSIQKLSQHLSICDNASCTCVNCKLLFDSRTKMQKHALCHNNPSINDHSKFLNKEILNSPHKNSLLDSLLYKCKQCNKIFKERFQLYKHAKEHVLKAEQRICDVCGHSFIGNIALAKHKKGEHGIADGLAYRCKICSHTSSDHKEMYLHVQKHIEIPKPTCHLCESCGRSFTTHASLKRHSQQQHSEGNRCSICEKTFEDVKARDKHVLEHIEMTMCEKCGENISCYKLDGHCCT